MRRGSNHTTQNKKTAGFTLIELILAIAILTIFLVALTYFNIDIFKAKAKSTAVAEVQENARFAMQKMTYYIRNSATGIDVSDSNFTPTDPGRLHVNMGAGAGDDVVFDVSSNTLQMSVGGGAATPITTGQSNVTSLIFENNSATGTPGNITINMTVEHNNPGGRQEYNYSFDVDTSVSLRQ
ncbi:type II secretion system GspH family protein [Patescibacteria group bacterium]|nr:type II secretion system GspH family protein [Patescibacteria group bacterium]